MATILKTGNSIAIERAVDEAAGGAACCPARFGRRKKNGQRWPGDHFERFMEGRGGKQPTAGAEAMG
jgi:hypothetical protein